jgi:hypothetical protein
MILFTARAGPLYTALLHLIPHSVIRSCYPIGSTFRPVSSRRKNKIKESR